MIPSFMDIQIAKRAMQVAQAQINVTGHNINNADDPTYSRQIGMQGTAPDYILFENGQYQGMGQGAVLSDISRSRDQFLDNRYRQVNSSQSQYQTMDSELQNITSLFNEPTANGFQNTMTNFFNSWQTLSKNPEDAATRSVVVEQGQTLAQSFNTIHQQLSTMIGNYQSEQNTYVTDINNISSQIASLTNNIQQAALTGDQSNDLQDQRDALIDKLATYGNVSVTQTADTTHPSIIHYTVTFAGQTIASDKTATAVTASSITPTSGSLKALSDLQTYAQNVSTKFDQLANKIITDVNSLQQAGYGYNNTAASPQTNTPFFAGTDAGSIAVNATVVNDPSYIAASGDSKTQGDGSNALAIANLMNNNHYDQTYGSLVAGLGTDNNNAHQNLLLYQNLTNQAQQARTSVMGVNINDEMANMVQYQQAYGAAARLMTSIDSMYSSLLNIQ